MPVTTYRRMPHTAFIYTIHIKYIYERFFFFFFFGYSGRIKLLPILTDAANVDCLTSQHDVIAQGHSAQIIRHGAPSTQREQARTSNEDTEHRTHSENRRAPTGTRRARTEKTHQRRARSRTGTAHNGAQVTNTQNTEHTGRTSAHRPRTQDRAHRLTKPNSLD